MSSGRLVRGVVASLLALASTAAAQSPEPRPGWRVGLGATVYRVDDLVGSPVVPSASLGRSIGRRGFVGLEVNGIFHRGFYSASALAGDLDLGVRLPAGRLEMALSAGPSGILGGDSDGTPYTGGGVHAAAGVTAWVTDRVGLTGRVRVRRWWGVGNDLLGGATFGMVLRL